MLNGSTKMPAAATDYKIFNDPIHGHMPLHPACVAIIDTEQFQRLRNIKQLALCYYVFPGASHNRFEHSIGVSYLAGQLVRAIRSNQPNLGITDTDVLCVEIAGLCHDLGHGPFSHLFDGMFMTGAKGSKQTWKHEQGSVSMFQYLVEANGLMEDGGALRRWGLGEEDVTFVKEQIDAPSLEKRKGGNWPYKGRSKEKGFLYEIVANKRNGMDVDKWDYLARDCHHLGIANSFDHKRIVRFARVISHDNTDWQICVRDKVIDDIYQMFLTRYRLHHSAYQHKVNCSLELMMTNALLAANDHLHLLIAKDLCKDITKISDCMNDMALYLRLHDGVMHTILDSTSPQLAQARGILQRVQKRDLYLCVSESSSIDPSTLGDNFSKEKVKDQLMTLIRQSENKVNEKDFMIQIPSFDFGMRGNNPMDGLKVYRKLSPDTAVPAPQPRLLMKPNCFREIRVRVYSCTRDEDTCTVVKDAFNQWLKREGLSHVDQDL